MYVIISSCERTLNSINYNRQKKGITLYVLYIYSFLRSKKHFKINKFCDRPQGQISSGYLNTFFNTFIFCSAAAV